MPDSEPKEAVDPFDPAVPLDEAFRAYRASHPRSPTGEDLDTLEAITNLAVRACRPSADQQAAATWLIELACNMGPLAPLLERVMADLRRRWEEGRALPQQRPLPAEAERLTLYLRRAFEAPNPYDGLAAYARDVHPGAGQLSLSPGTGEVTLRNVLKWVESDVALVEAVARECAVPLHGRSVTPDPKEALEAMRKAIRETPGGVESAPPPERLKFDQDTLTIHLDGRPFPKLDPIPFRLLLALHEARPGQPVSGEALHKLPGMKSKNLTREWDKLPAELRALVQSSGGKGYWLQFPTAKL
jgi:hypothetical protein